MRADPCNTSAPGNAAQSHFPARRALRFFFCLWLWLAQYRGGRGRWRSSSLDRGALSLGRQFSVASLLSDLGTITFLTQLGGLLSWLGGVVRTQSLIVPNFAQSQQMATGRGHDRIWSVVCGARLLSFAPSETSLLPLLTSACCPVGVAVGPWRRNAQAIVTAVSSGMIVAVTLSRCSS